MSPLQHVVLQGALMLPRRRRRSMMADEPDAEVISDAGMLSLPGGRQTNSPSHVTAKTMAQGTFRSQRCRGLPRPERLMVAAQEGR